MTGVYPIFETYRQIDVALGFLFLFQPKFYDLIVFNLNRRDMTKHTDSYYFRNTCCVRRHWPHLTT